MAVTTNTNTGTTTTTTMDLKRKVVDEDGLSSKTTNKKRVASTTSDEKGRTEIICSALAEKYMEDENDDDDEDDDDYVEDDDEDDSEDDSDADDSDVGSDADDSDEDTDLVDDDISVPAPVLKWAKSAPGIVISDEECLLRRGYEFVPHRAERKYHQRHHAGCQLVITNSTRDWLLATGSVELGGADGVREGYFEVELTADEDDEDMEMMIFVGVTQTRAGLDYTVDSGKGSCETPHWYLCANDGSLCGTGATVANNGKCFEDKQGQLDVGDRVGVLVNLDNGAGGDGGSVRFFVNGAEYGPGFKSGVIGPVVLGAELTVQNQVLTLLPDAQKPAGL